MKKDYTGRNNNNINAFKIYSQKNLLPHMRINRNSKEIIKLDQANSHINKYGSPMNFEYNIETKEHSENSTKSIDFIEDPFTFEKLSLCFYSSKIKKTSDSNNKYNLIYLIH